MQRSTKKSEEERSRETERGRQIQSVPKMAVIGSISQKPKPNAN